MVKDVDRVSQKNHRDDVLLFCPHSEQYSRHCHRGAKEPEHIHIEEAEIESFFVKKSYLKRLVDYEKHLAIHVVARSLLERPVQLW